MFVELHGHGVHGHRDVGAHMDGREGGRDVGTHMDGRYIWS